MARIPYADRRFLERLFIRSGYVLDFTNATFADFFESEVGIEIYSSRYEINGSSKGNRLRAFLKLDDNATVARALQALWDYRRDAAVEKDDGADSESRVMKIIRDLSPSQVTAIAEPRPVGIPHGTEPLIAPGAAARATAQAAISALASYAHQEGPDDQRVLDEVNRLRGDGIDCWSDHFEAFPTEGWPAWMQRQLSERRWILVFASESYRRRADGKEQPGRGLGVIWEHGFIRQELYEKGKINERFIPVGFGPRHTTKIPSALHEYTYFNLDDESDYQKLLSVLRGDPLIKPQPLGQKTGLIKPTSPVSSPNTPNTSIHDTDGLKPVQRLSSTVFFSDRFAQAFPGVRGISWFPDRVAVERLAILLASPLVFRSPGGGQYEPIWYWESGNLGIDRFRVQSGNRVLINVTEWDIKTVAAVNMGDYWQKFVYVETYASAPTGLYHHGDPSDVVEKLGYVREEFGIFQGHLVTREEYDDGAAVIKGKPVDICGSVELRIRYLTPYNFIIAAHNSAFNSRMFDRAGKKWLKEIREKKSTVEDFGKAMLELPKREAMRYEYE